MRAGCDLHLFRFYTALTRSSGSLPASVELPFMRIPVDDWAAGTSKAQWIALKRIAG